MFKRNQKSSPTTASSGTPTRNRIYLPSSLRVEVRSPGFSSRLSALINDGNENENRRRSSPLRPPAAASNFNPKYSGFGSRPLISFDKTPLPILSARNSTKVGPTSRFSPRSPVTMVKVYISTAIGTLWIQESHLSTILSAVCCLGLEIGSQGESYIVHLLSSIDNL